MKIAKVIRVEDTRQWEEGPDDRWYPIPGSGIENNCGRCGRAHEVHATVQLEDDSQMIVGTGCMRADEGEIDSQIKSTLAAQKTLAKNRHLLQKYAALWAQRDAIYAQVDKLVVPPIVKNEVVAGRFGSEKDKVIVGFCMGDAFVRTYQDDRPTGSEQETLLWSWRENRAREIGLTYELSGAGAWVHEIKKRIERIEKKLAKIQSGE